MRESSPGYERVCVHPHKVRGTDRLAEVPVEPIGERLQLVLVTDGGVVPYCGMDNTRAVASADNLGRRHIEAKTATAYDITSGDDYVLERWALPQMVLSMALAEREERFCVADSIRSRMADYPNVEPRPKWWPWPRRQFEYPSSSDEPKGK